jgi:hypothetical protein
MILARCASRWFDFGRLAIKISFSFSVGLRTMVATGLPIGIAGSKPHHTILQRIYLALH